MIQFENMRGNASPGQGTDIPANARWGNTNPRNSNSRLGGDTSLALLAGSGVSVQEKTPHYHSYSSAALDPHPTVANPLLPFGKFTQAVIDGLTVLAGLVLICATGVGLAAAIFFLFFCRF